MKRTCFAHQFPTPIGDIIAAVNPAGEVVFLYFLGKRDRATVNAILESSGYQAEWNAEQVAEVSNQIIEYFAGSRKQFTLRLSPEGTAFQQRVWNELLNIPYGEAISYGELATRVGNPKASRAVGAANGQNPISIIIPCHRVIGSDKSLTGYGGGLNIKEALLKHEGVDFKPARAAQAEPSLFAAVNA
jgi:methylated-DNA-[protein]-cysteine S-methyltransferase